MKSKKPLIIFLFFLLLVSGFVAMGYYHEKMKEMELNSTYELIKSDLRAYPLEYNITWPLYFNQKVDEKDVELAVNRVLLLEEKLKQMNASNKRMKEIENCLNDTNSLKEQGKFYDALTQARTCGILASDYIGEALALTNATELITHALPEYRTLTRVKNSLGREWREKVDAGVNFMDYMTLGLRIEDNLIKAEFFLNSSIVSLEKFQRAFEGEDVENITLLGSSVYSDLEFARSLLEDAAILLKHVDAGNFKGDGLKSNVLMLRDNLSRADRNCSFNITMVNVACDWKEYHKVRGMLALGEGYYSAANYHLLYALAIAEDLEEFEALALALNSSSGIMDQAKLIIKLRHEALDSLNSCPSDPVISLYINHAVNWYFRRGDLLLKRAVGFKFESFTTQPLYDYEMAKIIARKMCPMLTAMEDYANSNIRGR